MTQTKTSSNTPKLRFKDFSGEWEEKELGEIAEFLPGYAFSANLFGKKGKKLIIPKNFTKNGKALFTEENTKYTIQNVDKKFICKTGDLLVLLTDLTSSCELLGNPVLINSTDGDILLNQRILKIIPNNKTLNKFLLYRLLNVYYKKYIKETCSGSTVRHSSSKIISNYKINLPPLPEQQKIASFLSSVDEKIERLKNKKELLEEYKKGVMQKIFSREIKFEGDFGEWEEKKLGEIFENIGGTALEKYVNELGNYNFISIGNYTIDGKYINNNQKIILNEKTKTKLLEKDNLVMVLNDKTATGDMIGSSILIDEDNKYIYNQRSERLICNDNIFPKFIWFYLNSKEFRKRLFAVSQGGTQIYVNFGEVKKLKILLPSLPEQEKIADFLGGIDEKIESVGMEIERSEEFKKGLLQEMFV